VAGELQSIDKNWECNCKTRRSVVGALLLFVSLNLFVCPTWRKLIYLESTEGINGDSVASALLNKSTKSRRLAAKKSSSEAGHSLDPRMSPHAEAHWSSLRNSL
jgi:hypothetical protein